MESPYKERYEALLEWAHENGASLHPSIEIYQDEKTGFSLRVKPSATEPLHSPFKAVTCPTSITLSYLNALTDGPITPPSPTTTAAAPVHVPNTTPHKQKPAFPERFMTALPPHVIGRFYLIQQYLKGPSSFWAPYIATLPDPSGQLDKWALPPFWTQDDIELLRGTNAYVAIGEIQENVKSEYKLARKVLKQEGYADYRAYTQVLYNWAYCMFTSRSFRPSLILEGSVRGWVEEKLLLPAAEARGGVKVKVDDFSILQPLYDIGNHSPEAKYSWNLTQEPEPSACELVCLDSYKPGEQVFNNYGSKTNSELLLGYGFVTEGNDYVHVRKRQQPGGSTQNEGGVGGGEPQDFLISRQSYWAPGSSAIKSRMGEDFTPNLLHYRFSHWDGRMLDDMVGMMASPRQLELVKALPTTDLASDGDGNGGVESFGEELDQLMHMLTATLAQKTERDFVEFVAGEPNGGEEWEPVTERQALVKRYRGGYEKVFENVLREFGYTDDEIAELKAAALEMDGEEEEEEDHEMEDGN